MEVSCLSTAYRVRCLEEADVPQILRLCSGNPQFYQYHPPLATADSVRADIRALPPGKMPEDKFYVGYFAGDDLSTGTPSEERLTAVLDLILDYPEEKTAYIGFFMVDAAMQGTVEAGRRGCGVSAGTGLYKAAPGRGSGESTKPVLLAQKRLCTGIGGSLHRHGAGTGPALKGRCA